MHDAQAEKAAWPRPNSVARLASLALWPSGAAQPPKAKPKPSVLPCTLTRCAAGVSQARRVLVVALNPSYGADVPNGPSSWRQRATHRVLRSSDVHMLSTLFALFFVRRRAGTVHGTVAEWGVGTLVVINLKVRRPSQRLTTNNLSQRHQSLKPLGMNLLDLSKSSVTNAITRCTN